MGDCGEESPLVSSPGGACISRARSVLSSQLVYGRDCHFPWNCQSLSGVSLDLPSELAVGQYTYELAFHLSVLMYTEWNLISISLLQA